MWEFYALLRERKLLAVRLTPTIPLNPMKRFLCSALLALMLIVHAEATSAQQAFGVSDPINKGPLNIFPREHLFCGRRGWEFPVLIWGSRTTNVCMLRTRRRNGFGGDFGF
jgi:hypothetical protein